ncbi:MAG: sigma 54-interacting transcriptional regulator [Proteobacteria bacterium]|nr:sigma 54-interacting transcriptional regulator [Pseudomonadota bacterium]
MTQNAFRETKEVGPSPAGISAKSRVVRGFQLEIVEGPCDGARWQSISDRCTLGSDRACDFVIDDPTVSRFHCEIILDGRNAQIRDLDSVNGVFIDGVKVRDGFLRTGSLLRLGESAIRFRYSGKPISIPRSKRTRFGLMVGRSVAMQSAFALLERAADNDLTVLLQGETGTGKSVAAQSIHDESRRKDGPFIMVACSAIPANLLESELFGHVKGAFSDATDRAGAFENADGGTLFLDEIGELPLPLQSKLLTVLDKNEFRRIGCHRVRKVDVRVIGATNRDVRAEVNAGRFRSDLYFRIAVLTIRLPPLRECTDDLPLLVKAVLAKSRLEPSPDQLDAVSSEEFLASLNEHAWPGNIREFKNHLERSLALDLLRFDMEDPEGGQEGPAARSESADQPRSSLDGCAVAVDTTRGYREAKKLAQKEFDRVYFGELLRQHGGNVTKTALQAGIGREYCHRLIRSSGLKEKPDRSDNGHGEGK